MTCSDDDDPGALEDRAYDEWRQRMVDARCEGREAGRKGRSVEMNPYFGFEQESKEWLAGRLEGLTQQPMRKIA